MIPFLPMIIGAVAGAALKPNDPLRGAMLGATIGFTGGTALGIGAAGATGAAAGTAGTAAGTTAGTVGSAAGTSAMAVQPALSYAGGNIANAANMANTANATNLAAMNSAGMSFAGMPSNVVNASNTANTANVANSVNAANTSNAGLSFAGMSPNAVNTAPSFMDKLGMAGKSAYAHPGESLAALNATQGLLAPEQIASAPAVPIQTRGQLRPFDPVALLDPYKPSVIGNSQFSLI
jgi:hypothetical protein